MQGPGRLYDVSTAPKIQMILRQRMALLVARAIMGEGPMTSLTCHTAILPLERRGAHASHHETKPLFLPCAQGVPRCRRGTRLFEGIQRFEIKRLVNRVHYVEGNLSREPVCR